MSFFATRELSCLIMSSVYAHLLTKVKRLKNFPIRKILYTLYCGLKTSII